MHVAECTAIVSTTSAVYTSEHVEGLKGPGDSIDKVMLHQIGQILKLMYDRREEGLVEWAFYCEVRPLQEMERAREAFIKWRMNQPKRMPLDWKREATISGKEGR